MFINYSIQILTQSKDLMSVSFYNKTKALVMVGGGHQLSRKILFICLFALPKFQESREPKFCYILNRRSKQTK